ncbi:MAG TPA: MATE family efflux transporter [Chitinophagaceae bacterium]|nr:MATE family efflux transporter [Chitinophagaceae bacterium]
MATASAHTDLQVEISNRQILKIALPISLALLVPQINFVTNNVFLSGLGESELGTAGITGVFYLVFALIGNGLNSGLQGLIARRAGENRPEEIGKLFGQSIWIALIFAAAGILITYLFAPWFLTVSLQSSTVLSQAISFLKICIWGLPLLYLFQMGNAFLVGTNNSRYMKYGFWIQAGLNIFLDYVLIYGHWGFPKLGFNGAAVASVIAQVFSVLVIFGIIFYKKFHHRFGLFAYMPFSKPLASLIFRQSSPLVLQWLLSVGAWLLFYILIENKGERPLAISNAMRNIFGLFGIFVWAFASTSNAMVSNIIGQGKKDKVVMLIKKIMNLSFVLTFFLCLLINIFPDIFLKIYDRDISFTYDAIPVIRMVTAGMLSMSIATIWLNAVTGTGNTRINLLIEIAAITIYTLYIWLALKVWNLSLVWAWASELLYWASLFTLSFLYIRSGKWRKKVL